MSIPIKDQKILWSRAMGLCSICKKKLTIDASDAVPSRAILVGENCHIVAESEDGPRGESCLTEEDRNRYPNLILLCSEHHTRIDQDPQSWPIELLHQIKTDHELWVESLVPVPDDEEINALYADLVNFATDKLYLRKWVVLTDSALCNRLLVEFVDGVREFAIRVTAAIWPGKYPGLEQAICNLERRVAHYVDLFLEGAYFCGDGWLREDNRWKLDWVEDYAERIAASKRWEQRCTIALFNTTVALNEFADAVRATVKPTYFLHEGKFFVADSLGLMSDMEGTAYFPFKYQDDI